MGIRYSMMVSFLILIVVLFVSACSDNRALELYQTAQFEEVQNNREHALQLYHQIISEYPSSDFAVKARERIAIIKKQ
jgi:outer membrane protein assembly factor BamD (BamD/ComL family)